MAVSFKHISLLVFIHTENKIGKISSYVCISPFPLTISGHTSPCSEIIRHLIFHSSHFRALLPRLYQLHLLSTSSYFPAFTHLKNIKTCTLMPKHCIFLWKITMLQAPVLRQQDFVSKRKQNCIAMGKGNSWNILMGFL